MAIVDEVSAARKRIFRDGYDISFRELVSLYEKKELLIQPEYQRLFRWNQTQKTRFIESLLLNIPIPPVFVFSDEKGRWELVDGLQRVSTVLEFMGKLRNADGELTPPFTCDGTALIASLKGIRWPTLEEEIRPTRPWGKRCFGSLSAWGSGGRASVSRYWGKRQIPKSSMSCSNV